MSDLRSGAALRDNPRRRRKRKRRKKATKLAVGAGHDGTMLDRLYVANLPFDATEEQIRREFSDVGTITIIKMPLHRCKETCLAAMQAEARQRLLTKGLRRKPRADEIERCPREGKFQGFAFVTVAKLKSGMTLEDAAEKKCGMPFQNDPSRVMHCTVADPPPIKRMFIATAAD